jgi:hypothetical protein
VRSDLGGLTTTTPHDQLTCRMGCMGWGGLKVSAQEQKEIGKKLFIFECFLKFANPFEMELDLNFK